MVRLEGLEPPTYGLGIRRSIHLSYRRLGGRRILSRGIEPGERARLGGRALAMSHHGTGTSPELVTASFQPWASVPSRLR